MKAFLVVLLLAIVSCKFPDDLIQMAKCAIKSETAKGLLPKVLEAIKTGEYLSLIQTLIVEFPKVKEEVKECVESEQVLKSETLICDHKAFHPCVDSCRLNKDRNATDKCIDKCISKHCHPK